MHLFVWSLRMRRCSILFNLYFKSIAQSEADHQSSFLRSFSAQKAPFYAKANQKARVAKCFPVKIHQVPLQKSPALSFESSNFVYFPLVPKR